MASVGPCSLALVLAVVAVSVIMGAADSKSINIINSCTYTVWPGISSSAGGSAAALDITGFELAPGESRAVPVTSGWSGRVWGLTQCRSCSSSTAGSGFGCLAGDNVQPVTHAQFSMDDGCGGTDLYDISLVNGYNLPISVEPQGAAAPGGRRCTPVGCVLDLDSECPAELRVMPAAGTGAVACKSACLAFVAPSYCCTGDYGTPDTCRVGLLGAVQNGVPESMQGIPPSTPSPSAQQAQPC